MYFKEHAGKTPMIYIKDIRIHKAMGFPSLTSKSIAKIGNEVRYPEIEYFSKKFKRETGFSPSDFGKLGRINPIILEL